MGSRPHSFAAALASEKMQEAEVLEGTSSVDGTSAVKFVDEAEKAARSKEVGVNRAEPRQGTISVYIEMKQYRLVLGFDMCTELDRKSVV